MAYTMWLLYASVSGFHIYQNQWISLMLCEINAYRHARTGVTLQCSENLEVYLLRILIVQNAASELIKRGLGLTVSWSQRVYDSIQKKLILMTS